MNNRIPTKSFVSFAFMSCFTGLFLLNKGYIPEKKQKNSKSPTFYLQRFAWVSACDTIGYMNER